MGNVKFDATAGENKLVVDTHGTSSQVTINDVSFENFISGLTIKFEAGEYPSCVVKVPIITDAEIDAYGLTVDMPDNILKFFSTESLKAEIDRRKN